MAEDFRVLIVDDDFHVAKLHAAYVDSVAGFLALAPVGTASLALQAIHSLRPDLVLLDVRMPNVNGEQFCRFIKSNSLFRGIKVLLCSGENVEELQRICREAGADGYVPKDAVMSSLVAKELGPAPSQE